MQPNPIEYQAQFPIELLAHFIRSLPLDDKVKLVKLVPELKTIEEREKESIPEEQVELIRFFSELVPEHSDGVPVKEARINGLTFDEFLLLPDEEQNTIWAEAHVQAEIELGDREIKAHSDAVPA